MEIASVRAVPGVSAYFTDDQAAITDGTPKDGFGYAGEPTTAGFQQIREPGEALLVEIGLTSGQRVRGDCAAVQYSGVATRDPIFRADEHVAIVEERLGPELVGRSADRFVDNARILEQCEQSESDHQRDSLHTAVQYGVSQALAAAAARSRETTQTQVLATALETTPASDPIAVFGQSGSARRDAAERMLRKRVPVLPHGLFNSLETVGADGEKLLEYVSWLSDRCQQVESAYRPRFHVDIYGAVGRLFGSPYDRSEVIDYFRELERAAAPYHLQVEEPMDEGSRSAQIRAMQELRDGLADEQVTVDLVADEWCDSRADVEAFADADAVDLVQVKPPDMGSLLESGRAIRQCAGTDTRVYLGGSCNETTRSAQACTHLGLATDVDQILAKPGMGFDEGFAVVTNEMRRTLARHRCD